MEESSGVMPKENAVDEIARIRLERENWEVERKRAEEKKIREEEEKRLAEEREKEKRRHSGKNAIIGLLATALTIIVVVLLISNYTSGIKEELEEKSMLLKEQNTTMEMQKQVSEAYIKGSNDAVITMLSQMVTSLNSNGFVEMELPIGANQTQRFKLGIIQ